jgi:hypothetical protein
MDVNAVAVQVHILIVRLVAWIVGSIVTQNVVNVVAVLFPLKIVIVVV